MKIQTAKTLDDNTFKYIKEGLKRSKQLKPETLKNIKNYAKEWIFIKDNENNILGHAAIKKSKREGFGTEIGFIYTYPNKEIEKDQIIYKLIEYIDKKKGSEGIYAEVLLSPIKRIFKKLGYAKIDEWDSEVREGQKVELYTNKDLIIISEDKMKKINMWNYLENKLNIFTESVYTVTSDGVAKGGSLSGGKGSILVNFKRQVKTIDRGDSDIIEAITEAIIKSGSLTDENKVRQMVENFLSKASYSVGNGLEIKIIKNEIVPVTSEMTTLDKTKSKFDKAEDVKREKELEKRYGKTG